ncbi:MAG: hypothetical protein LBG45_01610 [Dysgonamonadaceae bacterium]|jgi:hypothetical protein|nr:hypothetical protein [Dysgonamonadaceae bacterium]
MSRFDPGEADFGSLSGCDFQVNSRCLIRTIRHLQPVLSGDTPGLRMNDSGNRPENKH